MALTINTKIINDADNYSLDAKQVKGGYGVVATVADLASLPAATIISGSLYYVQGASKYYKYNGSSWEVAEFGGGNVDDVRIGSTSIVTNKIATIPNMTGATSAASGAAGLAPAPSSTDHDKFLRGDGTWADVLVQHTSFGTITTDASTTQYTYTHGLNTTDLIVQITDSDKETVLVDVKRATVNTITIDFGSAPGAGTFYVYCMAQSTVGIPIVEEVEY